MNPGRFSLSAFFLLVQITSGLPVTDSGGENATHFTSCPGDEVPSNYFARALSNPKDINGRYPNGTTVDLCCAGESPCIFSDTKPKASTCVNGRWTQKMCCPRNCPVLNETYLASTCGSMELPPGGSISYSPADDENGRYPNGTKATLCCTLIDFCTWDENDPEKVSVCVDGGWTNVFLKCPTVKDNDGTHQTSRRTLATSLAERLEGFYDRQATEQEKTFIRRFVDHVHTHLHDATVRELVDSVSSAANAK